MNIYSEENPVVKDVEVGDGITITGAVKGFTISEEGIVSLDLTALDIDIDRKNRDNLHSLRRSMDTALESISNRTPIPSPA